MAGHSKFKNIQHRKGAQDKKRAKHFSRLAREITAAARIGKPDPDANPRLRAAIQTARAANMPKDNIQRAIGKSSEAESLSYEEIRYEGFAAGGAGVIVETLTDNRNRTASDIRTIFGKKGGRLGETNSVSFMFDHVGEVFYGSDHFDEDAALEAALESGAEECRTTGEGHFFFSPPQDLARLASALSQSVGKVGAQRLAWRPKNAVSLSEKESELCAQTLEQLDDYDDVQHVYTNAEDRDGNPILRAPL